MRLLSFLIIFFSLPLPLVHADDFPMRKPGLWEIQMKLPTATQKMTQCVDEETDRKLLLQGQSFAKDKCSKNEMKKVGEKYIHESDCKLMKRRTISKMIMQGDFENGYTADMVTRYSPPKPNETETKIKFIGRYLGACKPGQNPGDTIMEDGFVIPLRG